MTGAGEGSICGGTLSFGRRICATRSGADFEDILKSARSFSKRVVVPRVHLEVDPLFSLSPVVLLDDPRG